MARIKKFAPKQNLSSFQTFLVDENPNSDYFRITEFKETFTGGKNGFLIEGSEYLKESTEIKIELLDVNGEPIYYEPGNGIPEYYEGISKLVAVYVYNDTPIGLGKITILGELKEYDENGVKRPIPTEWQGAYNVKWQRTFQVNKNLANEDKVRFYRRPKVTIDEVVKPIFSGNPPSVTQIGSVDGIPLVPTQNTNLSNFTLPTSYRLKVNSGNKWTGSIEGQTISFDNITYSPTINEVVNETEIVVSPPYSVNDSVQPFINEDYSLTFPYIEGVGDLATALTGSFAKINITDMKTFVGDAARVKVFRRSQSNLTDFEFVQEIQLESNELLRDITTFDKKDENYGIFTQGVLDSYWVTSSNDFDVTFNQDVLYNSAKLDSSPGNYFYTSQSFSIQSGVEYTLDLNVRKDANTSGDYLKVFLSGSINGSSVSQTITTIDSSNTLLQKTNFNENIIADNIQTASLYFEVSGSDWYINNVSLKASQETSFSPDEITFIQQVPKTLVTETFDYRFEFYDINNNFIPIRVETTKTFVGGNTNLFEKSIEITPDNLYFSFDSASNPANPIPPTVINFDVETTLVTGSITYTSGAYDFFGNLIPEASYSVGGYPGYLTDWNVDLGRQPFLRVQDFTGSREDIVVQFIRYTGEVEGVSDTFVITRVEDGKGGVSFEIVPFRGTQIKNKESKTLEIQAIRVDGINRIQLRDGLDRGFSDAKLHLLSSSIDGVDTVLTYVSLSQAITDPNFIEGVTAGTTGSGEIDYNAIFTRDSIDNELTVYLMDGPTSESILTSLILTDLKDGLNPGLVTSTTEQFNIKYKPREVSQFDPLQSIVTASFQRRGTTLNPLSASLKVIPSASIETKTELPHYYMFYETGAFDESITVSVTDFQGNVINNGVPGQTLDETSGNPITFFQADDTKQLNFEFTYTEPITSASVTANKSFFITPDGLPGQNAIIIDIDPQPVSLGSNPKGEVYNYSLANTDIQVTQGDLFLINTASGDPGTFTTTSVTPINISFGTLDGDSTTTMSLAGFSNMTALSASIKYDFDIYPYFTASLVTASRTQKFTKVVEGAGAIEVNLDPIAVSFNADESGFISNYTAGTTEVFIKQNDEFLIYDETNAGTPGTFLTASISASGITFSEVSSSQRDSSLSGDEILHFKGFGGIERNQPSASITYNFRVYPYALKGGVAGVPTIVSKTQTFSKVNDGSKARKVSLVSNSDTVIYDGDGTKVAPVGSVSLTATAFNTTGSAYFEFLDADGGTIGGGSSTSNTVNIDNYLPNFGSSSLFTVNLRDGGASSPIADIDSVTISGVKEGTQAYSAQLSNPASSVTVEVDGTTYFDNGGTLIRAYKGGTELQYVEEYNENAFDPITFLPIGTFGQFSASIHEISSFLTAGTLRDGKSIVSKSISPTEDELYASASAVTNWNLPQDNTQGYIIYKIDFENGRGTQFVQQSFSTVFEGATGPGLVVRGEWDETIPYVFDLNQKRRDAVFREISGDVHYWATTELTPTASEYVDGDGVYTLQPQYDAGPPATQEGDIDYATTWQYLGQQDFFVAAKLAIFEESFVKNTINVGIPPAGNQNANIAIVGGTDEPYISVGQTGTQGFRQPGVFIGMTNDFGSSGTAGTTGILSLKSSPIGSPPNQTYNSMEWDGNTLTIRGAIRQTAAGIIEGSLRGTWTAGSIYYPNDIVSNSGQSWTMIGLAHTASVDSYEPGVGVDNAESWSLAAAAGTSGTAGTAGSGGATAKTIRLSASSQTFVKPKDSATLTPASITFTTNRQNIASTSGFTSSPSVTLSGTGDTRTLSNTDFGTNGAVTVTATADGVSDEITIVRVEEGSDGITVVNTNQAHTLPAASDGTVSSYAGSGTTIIIYEGATKLTYDESGTSPGTYDIPTFTVTPNNLSLGTDNIDSNDDFNITQHSNMTADTVVITYEFSGKRLDGTDFTISTTQTLTKSKAGESGTSGTSGANGANGQAAGIVYAGEWTLTLPDGSTPDTTDKVVYLGEDDLKYVVKYTSGASNYWVCATTHRYTGTWSGGSVGYVADDVVLYSGTYYICVNATAPGDQEPNIATADWDSIGSSIAPGSWGAGWDAFGAEFTSVATDILFAQDVYADRTINVGAKNGSAVIALNADAAGTNANPYISIGQGGTQGYGQDGIFLGFDGGTVGVTGDPKFSMYADITDPESGFVDFDGTTLVYSGFVTGSTLRGGSLLVGFDTNSGEFNFRVNEQGEVTALGDNNTFSGTITANNGVLGGWTINSAGIQDSSGNITLNSVDSDFSVGDTDGNPRFNANTGTSLPDLSGGGSATAGVSTTAITEQLGVGNTSTGTSEVTNYRVSSALTVSDAGKYKMKAQHVQNSNTYVDGVGAGSYATIALRAELRDSSTGGGGTLYATSQTITQQSIGYDEGGIGYESVIEGTQITLSNGETKNVEDLRVKDTILAWNVETNQYESAKIKHLKSRVVDKVYRVKVGDNVVEVSDTHGFFYAPGWKIIVTDLRAGEDEVYVKEGDSFVKRIVDSVELIAKTIKVYSMEIPKLNNYISNNIVSHNFVTTIPVSGGINTFPSTNLTKTIESLAAGTYYVHYVIDTSLTVSAANTQYSAQFSYAPSGTTHYVTLEAQNTGTYVNGGGFAVIKDATNYFRVASDTTKAFGSDIGYISDIQGGLAVDKLYGAGGFTAAPGIGGAYNLAGHPYAIKGGGLINISFAAITTSNPTETIAMSFGNFDSISSTNYGRWNVTIDTVLSTGANADAKWFGMVGSGVRLITGGGGDDQQLGLGTGTVQSNVANSTATIQVWAQDPSATSSEDDYTNIARLNFIIIG